MNDVVATVEEILTEAASGEITGVFAVVRYADGSYGCYVDTDDIDEMLYETRTELILARSLSTPTTH